MLHSCMSWTPAKLIGTHSAHPLRKALAAARAQFHIWKSAHPAQSRCTLSSLDATLARLLVCVANKELTIAINPLDATLTTNQGWGAVEDSSPYRGTCN